MTDNKDKPDKPLDKSNTSNVTSPPPETKDVKPENAVKSSIPKKGRFLGSRKQTPKKNSPDKKTVGNYVREQRRARLLWLLTLLTLTIAVSSSYGIYWLWQQGLTETRRLGQQGEELSNKITALQQQNKQSDQINQSKRNALKTQLNEEFTDLVDSLRQQKQPEREPNWLLAEAEYLIQIADHRLQLAGDIDTAISAMMLADERLYALSDPRVLSVRRQLKNDINQLRALPKLDLVGVSLSLSSLQHSVTQLPLNRLGKQDSLEQKLKDSVEKDASSWTGFLDAVISTIRGLVTVRRVMDNTLAVVPPEQSAYLLQNLALKLESARYALLTKDEVLFHQSLQFVSDWLTRYFDQHNSAVQAVQSSLQEMIALKLVPDLPNVGVSLKAVQSFQIQRQQPETQPQIGQQDATSVDSSEQIQPAVEGSGQ